MNTSSQWYKTAIFYELNVRAFYDSNGDGHGDLAGAAEKLDYLKDLGVDCIWLQPINPSPLKDDGYDVSDYTGIAPKFGMFEDFDKLIEAAHARGMKVITDLVVNHTSDQHPWFLESRSSRSSAKRDWYIWNDNDQRYSEVRIIFTDTEKSNWSYDEASGQYYWHRFYSSQPDLNYDNPQVRQAIRDAMKFWLDKGIDGFRVDAVPYLIERDGTICENLPETHQVIKEMRQFVEQGWPDAMILAEANQPPQDVMAYFGSSDEFHMAFNFPLMPRIFMALHHRRAQPIKDALDLVPDIPLGCQWCTFLRNHDELTLEMVTPEERQMMWAAYAPDPVMKLNLGIRRRLAPLLGNDPRRIMLANHILFSIQGAPIIYYGDEIGMGDDLSLPDRNGVRTPMQWDDSTNGGFSRAEASALYTHPIDDPAFGFRVVNVKHQQTDDLSLLSEMKALISLRKRHANLFLGQQRISTFSNPAILGVRQTVEEGELVVIHNLDSETITVDADEVSFPGFHQISGRGHFSTPGPIVLEPYGSLWLYSSSGREQE